MENAMPHTPAVFTIGHSNHSEQHFLELLTKHGIQVLADVRSQPFSKYTPHFNREYLQGTLRDCRIKYLFMGDQLGGRPEGDEFYDAEGYVLYYRLAEAEAFLKGIERIQSGIQSYRVAMMCSEEDPSICHRHRLIAKVLNAKGIPIQHIRDDGRLDTFEQVEPAFQQLMLFGELETDEWKSLLSVLPKPAPENSLEN